MKICSYCKMSFENNNFYNKSFCCKECYNKYLKKWRRENNNYHREWKKNNPNYMKEWWINHQGYLREWWIKNDYNNKFKDKLLVQRLAQKIKIPKNYLCEICQINKVTQRHHEDYNKPLEIIFCCKKCHGLLDEQRHIREEKKIT